MTYRIRFDEQHAYRPLRKLEVKAGLTILTAIMDLAADPYPPASKQLVGSDALRRLRVGDYRVIYEVVADAIQVHEVGHRREIYD